MSDQTPAVSEAMREAVEDILWPHLPLDTPEVAASILAGPIASEIARLTGERDAAVKSLNACIAGMERGGTCKRVYSDVALGRELEAAEAETARLRTEVADARAQGRRAGLEEAAILVEACALGSNETVIAICDIIADCFRKAAATAPTETQKPEKGNTP